jgi:hypothetical protein
MIDEAILLDIEEKAKFLASVGVVRDGALVDMREELVDRRYLKK